MKRDIIIILATQLHSTKSISHNAMYLYIIFLHVVSFVFVERVHANITAYLPITTARALKMCVSVSDAHSCVYSFIITCLMKHDLGWKIRKCGRNDSTKVSQQSTNSLCHKSKQ